MALIVEDGTGLVDANTFAPLAEADAFLALRGVTAWAVATVAAREVALINASEYVSDAYQWIGARSVEAQALAWPRTAISRYSVPAGVPNAVKVATFRVAAILLATPTLYGSVKAAALVRRVQAGSVSVEFSDDAIALAGAGEISFPWLDRILDGLYTSRTSSAEAKGLGAVTIERV